MSSIPVVKRRHICNIFLREILDIAASATGVLFAEFSEMDQECAEDVMGIRFVELE